MTRRLIILVTAIALHVGATHVFAHDVVRVVGTVTKYENSRISVKDTNTSTTTVFRVYGQTDITRDKKTVQPSELKAGITVVVDGYRDADDDVLASDIQIVPPIASKGK